MSLLGTQVTNLALPLTAIHAFDASDEQVGFLRFLQLAPYLGPALVFGVWVDRVRRRPVMLTANLVRLVLPALIPALYAAELLSLGLLLAIACAVGVASVLFDVSWMSYVPVLVRDPRLSVEAGSKMGISSSSAEVAGPGLAGLLVSALSARIALVVNAFGYLVSVASLLLIRTPEPPPTPREWRCRGAHATTPGRRQARRAPGARLLRPPTATRAAVPRRRHSPDPPPGHGHRLSPLTAKMFRCDVENPSTAPSPH